MKITNFKAFHSWIKKKYEYLEEINKNMPYGNKFKLFFRGENDNSYKLGPSIYRNGRIINEHKFYYEALNRCPEAFKDCHTTFERLVRMQHYGIPTRLLDITENPLVALYFATQKSNKNHDARIYCFYVSERAIKYPDDSNTALLSNIATVNSTDFYDGKFITAATKFSNTLKKYSSSRNTDERRKFYEESKQLSRTNPVINDLINKSLRDSGYYASEFGFDDIAKFVCVKPKTDNRRVSNQSSAFLLFGFLCDKNFVLPLSDFAKCREYLPLLNVINSKNEDLENEIINKLPLDDKVKERITKIKTGSGIFSFGSSKKEELSFEISYKQTLLFCDLVSNFHNIILNAHSLLSTSRNYNFICNAISDYILLDFFKNMLWRNYPLIFFDTVEISAKQKSGVLVDVNRLGISDDFIFPDLESISPVLTGKFDHLQPLIVEEINGELTITHLSQFAEKQSKLKVGDIILSHKTVEEFWNDFSLGGQIEIKVRRRTSVSKSKSSGTSKGFKDLPVKLINDFQISSFDNPLIVNYSESSFHM